MRGSKNKALPRFAVAFLSTCFVPRMFTAGGRNQGYRVCVENQALCQNHVDESWAKSSIHRTTQPSLCIAPLHIYGTYLRIALDRALDVESVPVTGVSVPDARDVFQRRADVGGGC